MDSRKYSRNTKTGLYQQPCDGRGRSDGQPRVRDQHHDVTRVAAVRRSTAHLRAGFSHRLQVQPPPATHFAYRKSKNKTSAPEIPRSQSWFPHTENQHPSFSYTHMLLQVLPLTRLHRYESCGSFGSFLCFTSSRFSGRPCPY